ncbi:hypothetical protein AmDm5_1702 [Acetobacter malorum]|nr:hypothetical protein AmDm5_1702 [Acetobacter malorum]
MVRRKGGGCAHRHCCGQSGKKAVGRPACHTQKNERRQWQGLHGGRAEEAESCRIWWGCITERPVED